MKMRDIEDKFLRQFEDDNIEQLRCHRDVCALAFRLLKGRMKRYGLSELQKEKFSEIIEDLAELVRYRG